MNAPTTETPAASKVVVYSLRVEFGDCDPARIVWFPNFFRWIDAASRHFFVQCGVPPWHETEATLGVIGTPLVDTHASFVKTASYGDCLDIHTSISEWREKSFVQTYQIRRAQDDIMRCEEVRIFAAHRDTSKTSIRALPIPPSIKALCQGTSA
jgi:4-hydroxybenzoyl-CoA thioesterase